MTNRQYKSWKRSIEVAKDYQEFSQRLRMSEWKQSSDDWQTRIEALIQFQPEHSTRQILNRTLASIRN